MDLRKRNVGDIVAERFSTASIFYKFGIDFCCHGQVALDEHRFGRWYSVCFLAYRPAY